MTRFSDRTSQDPHFKPLFGHTNRNFKSHFGEIPRFWETQFWRFRRFFAFKKPQLKIKPDLGTQRRVFTTEQHEIYILSTQLETQTEILALNLKKTGFC